MTEQEDVNKVDTIAYTPDESDDEPFNTAINDTFEDPTIIMGKLVYQEFYNRHKIILGVSFHVGQYVMGNMYNML